MNLTLHLTENCNMNCSYCTRNKCCNDMSEETIYKACDMIFSSGNGAGFTFFGGEPLLRKDLIYKAIDRCNQLSEKTGKPFNCKMTTNGTLLDQDFLEVTVKQDIVIALSFDGLAQDRSRVMCSGQGSLSLVEDKARMLLKYMPRSYAMMTIAPDAAGLIAESVEYLYNLGFRRITFTIAYGEKVIWTDESLALVEEQLKKVADFYIECFSKERFFFGPFDGKIRDVINGSNPKERCHLGMRQLSTATDGKLYACTQFIGDEEFCLGDVFNGIDKEAAQRLVIKNSLRVEPEDCKKCSFRDRCTHTCGCTNRLETGNEDIVSAVTCNYEQMIIRLADRVGERLFNEYPEQFKRLFI